MDNIETFHSVPIDSLAHIYDEETSASELEFPQAIALPDGPQITSPNPYFDENQVGTSSCVTHAIGTAIEIKLDKMNNLTPGTTHVSRMFPYRQRSGYSAPGSSPYEMTAIFENKGWIPYSDLPTPPTEVEANAIVITDEMYNNAKMNANAYTVKATPLAYTEDALIAAVMSGEPVLFTFVSSIATWRNEYIDIPLVAPDFNPKTATVCHEQVIMPNSAFIKDGKTWFTTAESAHIAGLDHHHFSWDFLSKYMYNPMIISVAKVTHNYPAYEFGENLGKGMRGLDITYLQQALVADGVMEEPAQYGYFGIITLNAVISFQKKYGIPKTGFVGQLTRAKLNELCFKQK